MSLETINFDTLALKPGDRLLDLGCGEGRHAITAYLLADVHVVGLDINSGDLHTAVTRLKDFDNKPATAATCGFIRASGFALPFADNTFDKVICAEVLEHIPHYRDVLQEIKRVLKPGGTFAASVPRYFPEWICWKLSDAYHAAEGGHVHIFRTSVLTDAIQSLRMRRFRRHWAHALHVPYWWLRCLLWREGEQHALVNLYHRLLVWDLMQQPPLTRWLEHILNPVMGKSIVMYFVNEQ